jgi:uncharacterized coiled-coil protein SlyX
VAERIEEPRPLLKFITTEKTVELEQRVARNELLMKEMSATIEALQKWIIALQAHLEHVIAKLGRY